MIKNLTFLFLISLALGCSSDDSNVDSPENNETELVLVKKITETVYYDNQEEVLASNFTYENNKLVKIDNGSDYDLRITYDGNKVLFSKGYVNNQLNSTSSYIYEGDNLVKIQMESSEKAELTYVNGNLASISYYSGYNDSWSLLGKETYTFNNGNISQVIDQNSNGGMNSTSKSTYVYGSGKNPFKDLNFYLRLTLEFEGIHPLNTNIATSSNYFNNLEATTPSSQFTFQTIYNSENFPTEIKRYDNSNNLLTKTAIEYY
ncbi:hypothetical protein ACFPVY_16345 [Flavobacterium qiangtangense]|uniref:DUF4595 domain-containing protein n=1 Tax=Flavobacterium qiangtangense TaxID=1442595 RepID=A0ABW1PTV5_9FLAO